MCTSSEVYLHTCRWCGAFILGPPLESAEFFPHFENNLFSTDSGVCGNKKWSGSDWRLMSDEYQAAYLVGGWPAVADMVRAERSR